MIPKVSVIIPVYHTEQYLEECVESVKNQTLQDIEIILVDDESPDHSPELCDKYAFLDDRIKVIHKKNGGLGFARNSGLKVALGEYIAFVDSDDFIAPTMMDILYSIAKRYDADVVRSGVNYYNDGMIKERRDVDNVTVFKGKQEVERFVLDWVGPLPEDKRDRKYAMSVCLSLHKRSMIENSSARFTSERLTLSEDFLFDLDIFPRMSCVVIIPNCFYYYRYNPKSLTHTFSMEKYKKERYFLECVKLKLEELWSEDVFMIHYLRFKFFRMRCDIAKVVKSKDSESVIKKNIISILGDPLWSDVMGKYPYKRFEIRHRLYFILLRWKLVFFIKVVHKYLI